MDSLKKITSRRFSIADRGPAITFSIIALLLVLGALGGEAVAFTGSCADLVLAGAIPPSANTAGSCTIAVPITTLCPFALTLTAAQSLSIAAGTPAGSISCSNTSGAGSADTITINVPDGNMVMGAGTFITAENTGGGGNGAAISVTVSGDFLMQGAGSTSSPPSPLPNSCSTVAGACISSSDVAGGGGTAGKITITVGKDTPPAGLFTMAPGSAVLANSTRGSGGEIIITSGLEMSIDGVVRSFGGIGGTGAGQPNGGGPITLKTGCELTITPAGVVSSEGENPGADLVHLEGCVVVINGLVQSIARGSGGHIVPAGGNRCNDANAPPVGLANAFTACVEVWGNNITINSIAPNNGEVNANGIRSPNRAWISLTAQNNITINNDTLDNYSVHANSATVTNSNSFGGVVTIKAGVSGLGGTLTTSGEAVQANGTGVGSDGGAVTMQADGNVTLGASSIEARGPNGDNTRGGTISVRSFNGFVSGNNATGELDAFGGVGGDALGVVTLAACTFNPLTGPVGMSYRGSITPPPGFVSPPFPACSPGTGPTPPTGFAIQLDCEVDCEGDCRKRGRKFFDNDGDGPGAVGAGLGGWEICVFPAPSLPQPQCVTTAADGTYEFTGLQCGVPLTFCEVLLPGWTQTFPPVSAIGTGNVVSCAGLVDPVPPTDPLGPVGYQETLVEGQPSEGNDFGNFKECPEDPDAACTINVGPNGVPTVQDAYNNASNGDVICVFANTTENVVLSGSKSLTITQCTTARVTAATNSLPVWTISSTGALTIIGPDAKNGSIGWLVESAGHDIKGVRATGASQAGIKITGDNNKVTFNAVSGSAVGVRIEGTGNDVRGGTVSGNTTGGVQLGNTASNNSFGGATVRNNTGVGILVQGPANMLNGNQVNGNTGPNSHGIHVTSTAAGTKLKSNKSGNPENGGAEYQLDVDAIDQGGNRARVINIPKGTDPQKCPTFPAAGTCK